MGTSTSDARIEQPPQPPLAAGARGTMRLAAWLAGGCARMLPQGARFTALVHAARMGQSAFRRTNLGRWHRARLTSSAADTALFACCELLDQRRILYDPKMEVIGEDLLAAALQRNRGVVLLSVHGILSNLLIRYYDADRRLAPTFVAVSDQTSFVSGAGRRPDILMPSPAFLVTVRTRLRNGAVVIAMVDRAADHPRSLHFTTRHGPIAITDSLLRLAAKLGAPVLFTTCHAHDGKVVVRIEEVTAGSGDLDAMTAALVSRIEADMDRVARALLS